MSLRAGAGQGGLEEEAACDSGEEPAVGPEKEATGWSRAQGTMHRMRLMTWAVGRTRLYWALPPGEGFDSVSKVLGSH